jgi:hypothetical protein
MPPDLRREASFIDELERDGFIDRLYAADRK